MERLLDPITYIDRHLEPPKSVREVDDVARAEAEARNIYRPLDDIDYEDTGNVELKADDTVVYYEYRPASSIPERRSSRKPFGSIDDWRELSCLVLLNEKSGQTAELKELYPDAYDIAFRVTDYDWRDSYSDYVARKAVVSSTLMAPAHLAALLHEVGHGVDKAVNPYLYSDLTRTVWQADRGDPLTQSMMLRSERNAWAFAMNMMRPFLSRDPASPFYRKAMERFIYLECLQSYNNRLKEAREGRKKYLAQHAFKSA